MWLTPKMQVDPLFLISVYWLLWLGRRSFRSGLDREESDVAVSHCSVAGQVGLCPALLPAYASSFLFRGKGPGCLTRSMPAYPALSCFQTLPIKISLVWLPNPATADRDGYQYVQGQSLPGGQVYAELHKKPRFPKPRPINFSPEFCWCLIMPGSPTVPVLHAHVPQAPVRFALGYHEDENACRAIWQNPTFSGGDNMTYLPVDNNCIRIFAANGSNCHIRATNIGRSQCSWQRWLAF